MTKDYASILLGEEAGDRAEAERAVQGDADVRQAVARQLFVHGLLRGSADMADPARKARRVARVVEAIRSQPLPALAIFGIRRSALVAALVLMAAGLALQVGTEIAPDAGLGPRRATAEELVQRARVVATREVDREYAFAVWADEAPQVPIRRGKLLVRGSRWVLVRSGPLGESRLGFDGSRTWLVPPPGLPDGLLQRLPAIDRIRAFLDCQAQQVQISGLLDELSRHYTLSRLPPGPAPGLPSSSCEHIRGTREGMVPQIDVWIDARTDVPVAVEVRLLAEKGALPGRRLVFTFQGETALPAGFFDDPAGARR